MDHHPDTRPGGELLAAALGRSGRRLLIRPDLACTLLEECFMRCRRDAVIFDDPDDGERRLQSGLTELVRLISEEQQP